ncbi:MAG TPA: hypothetical protein VFE57_04385 [Cyclobacteriaceae bacterium]|nr:hypothetical protein [Cyclobacteriaceae bacterium]
MKRKSAQEVLKLFATNDTPQYAITSKSMGKISTQVMLFKLS